jgi:hypothetical protein
MATTINASASSGLITTADTSTILQLQTGGTTAVTVDASQNVTLAGTLTATGVTTVPAGTVSAPAITTTGDTNTGIFFPAADTIAFTEGGAESMRIDSSGNVGIGTSSPAQKLHVAGVGQFVSTNTMYVNPNYDTGVAAIQVSNNAGLVFATNNIERARIDSSGNLLVGTTSNPTTNRINVSWNNASVGGMRFSPSSTSYNQSAIEFYDAGSTRVGYIYSTGSATTYSTSSDYRLKENIAPMQNALNLVQQLKPVTYNWKADGSDGQGFIAHELQAVVPDCVTGEKDAVETYTDEDGNEQTRPAYQGIDTSFLVATLTAAIQELKALVDTQASTITQLQADVAALKGASA